MKRVEIFMKSEVPPVEAIDAETIQLLRSIEQARKIDELSKMESLR
jgi:hypothetical protein